MFRPTVAFRLMVRCLCGSILQGSEAAEMCSGLLVLENKISFDMEVHVVLCSFGRTVFGCMGPLLCHEVFWKLNIEMATILRIRHNRSAKRKRKLYSEEQNSYISGF